MLIERKEHTTKQISTSSLPDIIFLLLVFFMVVTVMKEFDAPKINMPYAKAIKKLDDRRKTTFVWITKDGFAVLNDIQFPNIASKTNQALYKKTMGYRAMSISGMAVSLKADNETKMSLINIIHTLNKDPDVNALKLSYSALRKAE